MRASKEYIPFQAGLLLLTGCDNIPMFASDVSVTCREVVSDTQEATYAENSITPAIVDSSSETSEGTSAESSADMTSWPSFSLETNPEVSKQIRVLCFFSTISSAKMDLHLCHATIIIFSLMLM